MRRAEVVDPFSGRGCDIIFDGYDLAQILEGFQLFERAKKSDQFGEAIVDLLVEVEKNLNSKAEAMAVKGMTPSQAAFAVGPAADTAKDPNASYREKQAEVQATLKR